jgi:hypothetical protein
MEKKPKPYKNMNKNIIKVAMLLIGALIVNQSQAATVNVGAVASSAGTGQFLSTTGAINTAGLIKVGFFSGKTSADLTSIVSGWTGATTAYQRYNSLNSLFTQIGTVVAPSSSGGSLGGSTTGLYNAAGAGWNFSTAGAAAGTASYVDLALVPQNTQMYIWAFNNSDFSASTFNPTQWALVTNLSGTSNWVIPGSGTLSMTLSSVTRGADVILGTDAGTSINMVNVSTIPEPSSASLLALGVAGLVALRARRKS